MKLYSFYKYADDIDKNKYQAYKDQGISDKDIRPLYAVTVDKKLAKKFEETRDMKQFVKVVQDIDKEDVKDYYSKHRSKVLDDYEYVYYPGLRENRQEHKTIKIVSTYSEYNTTVTSMDDQFSGLPVNINFVSPFILKDKYLNALIDLNYDSFFKASLVYIDSQNLEGLGLYVPDDVDLSLEMNLKIDEVALFICYYGNLMA